MLDRVVAHFSLSRLWRARTENPRQVHAPVSAFIGSVKIPLNLRYSPRSRYKDSRATGTRRKEERERELKKREEDGDGEGKGWNRRLVVSGNLSLPPSTAQIRKS